MVKLPKFLTEYAEYEKERFFGYPLMKEEYKTEAVVRIAKAVQAAEQGLITIHEAMRIINDPLDGIAET